MSFNTRAYALAGSTLVSFNPAVPAVATSSITITGVVAGQTLVGIDFRPSNGLLYALGVNATTDTGTLYTISLLTGAATIIGAGFGGAGNLPASDYGFDFNPVVDIIRVVTASGLNFRINPNTGGLAATDTAIVGNAISGAAYTNDETNNGGVTTLYTLDAGSDQLKIQGATGGGPNGGVQTSVGSVGVFFSTVNGFDIPPGVDTLVANSGVPSGSGLALLTIQGTVTVQLYSINLVTGAGTLIGTFLPGATSISGLAIQHTPSIADFNFDGRSDLLWQNDNGTPAQWFMNGSLSPATAFLAAQPAAWHITGTGDFNQDNTADILWRHDDGTVAIWFMKGAQTLVTQTYGNAPPDWHIQGTADFNNDGKTDILWRQDSGTVGIWHMNGAQIFSTPTVANAPAEWHIQGTGDFNGDGFDDILWRHNNGTVGTWHMAGGTILSNQAFGSAPADWHIVGTGDFNNDGRDDILWRQDSGTVGIWLMNGATILASPTFGGTHDWHIVGTGDFNNDGKADILWRNDNGTVGTWYMNGTTVLSTATFAAQPPDWHIVAQQFDYI